jgi:Mg-chelatase subunit ChlD
MAQAAWGVLGRLRGIETTMRSQQHSHLLFLWQPFLSSTLAAIAAALISQAFPAVAAPALTNAEATTAMDLVVVLDNSGSMKKNDPQSLMRQTVAAFAERLESNARLALVIFDQSARVPLSLTEARSTAFARNVRTALAQVDYRGQLTDIPLGLERALYELKTNGRPDAQRLVVLLTDGAVALGDSAKNLARGRWLREELVSQARRLGAQIFGIAFTEAADFQLMQALAESTGGDYFRVLSAPDIPDAFQHITASLEALARERKASPAVSEEEAAEGQRPDAGQKVEAPPAQTAPPAEQAPSAAGPAEPPPAAPPNPPTPPAPQQSHFPPGAWWMLLVGVAGLGAVLAFLYTRR